MIPWHQRSPQLVEQIRADLACRFPQLHLFIDANGLSSVCGSFPVRAPDQKILDRYSVSIEIPADFPKSLPVVREVGGRIPWHPDSHVNSDGVACVLIPDDRWRCFPEGTPFVDFLDGPLHQYFLGHTCVALGKPWPFGQWNHGDIGKREYYAWLLETDDESTIVRFLRVLTRPSLRHHLQCPCGSGRKIRRCCRNEIALLRARIPPDMARQALIAFGAGSASNHTLRRG